jgi:DNA polymerase (family 10)
VTGADNATIARTLAEIADLLEIREENPFKVRAYRRAKRTVQNLTRPLAAMVEAGADLTTLPGIGRDIAKVITDVVRSGASQRLADLEKDMPASLAELMQLDGVGPKRARQLHEKLGIATIADLKRALESGEIAGVPGFGPKTVDAIRDSLARPRVPIRFRLAEAEPIVEGLLDWMRGAPGLERIEAAGSYRRRAETVGDIDLLAACASADPAMERFTSFAGVAKVLARGSTRASIVLASGLQVDLRIVPHDAYGAALHYFTGSKAHNVAVRALAVARGLRISEYGVFRVPDGADPGGTRDGNDPYRGELVGGETEDDVFRAVGMPFVPPELREDRGEIGMARSESLPHLISADDMRGDLHMHSTWSDGRDTIEAMVLACIERGYEYMAITDHSPALGMVNGLGPDRLERQWDEIQMLREKYPAIRILRGMEVDILADGSLDLPDSHLGRLDIVIASVHSGMRSTESAMTERILRALAHPEVDVLGHPTGRRINEREPYAVDMEAVLAAALEHDVAVEVNAQPHRLDLRDVHVRRARELGVRILIDTDSHGVGALRYMQYGIDQARRGWIERDDVLNTRPLAGFERWLKRRTATV